MSIARMPVLVAFVLALMAFGSGVVAGSAGIVGVRLPTIVGDGMVGDQVTTLWSGNEAFGAKSSVAWRDASGAEHDSGWPDCLATPGEVTGVRFNGAIVWHDGVGYATIFWIDCSGR